MFTTIYDEPSGIMPTAASPIVQAAIDSLDRVNDAIEREVAKANLKRHALGALIERLIAQLDDAEADPDLEPAYGYIVPGYVDEQEEEDEHFDALDLGEHEDEGGDEDAALCV